MGKLFKICALLLVLSLVIGYVPVSAADSLAMQKEKVLYIDGSKGKKDDGTFCKTSYKKLVANMIKGFDIDTMAVVLTSEDAKICKTTKTGRIVAKSIGTTTVNVKVIDETESVIFNQDLKVKVKKNASDVTVNGITADSHYTVGQTVLVGLPRVDDTDERELVADKPESVEIIAG